MGVQVKDLVYVGYCTAGEVRVEFSVNLSLVMGYNLKHNIPYAGEIPMIGSRIASNRNSIVRKFLSDPRAEWLLMIDTDMTFTGDIVEQFLRVADKDERPFVGGLCYGMGGEGFFPTLYHFNGEHFTRSEGYPDNTLIPVDGTGAACIFVHRRVFEEMADKFQEPYPWFEDTVLPTNRREMGEDMTFCLRARTLGIPIFVHTGIQFGHIKEVEINREFYESWCRAHQLIVTGTGRCGTGYVSKVLQSGMVPADHERFFNPAHHRLEDWARADVSWLAAPYLIEYPNAKIVHLVRHPLRVLESFVSIGLFDDDTDEPHQPYQDFIREHAPHVFDEPTPLGRAVAFYLDWVERIERYASVRWRVEDQITPETVAQMFMAVGSRKGTYDARAAIDMVPSDVNSRPHTVELSWDDVPEAVRDRAKEFGYWEWKAPL